MHHYSTSTSLVPLGIRERAQGMYVYVGSSAILQLAICSYSHRWRDYIPKQALKHSFLMHGILALSALHLAYLHRYEATEYLQLCDKHQTVALKKFRTILSSEIDPDVADALFALASTISVSSMARSCAAAEAMEGPRAVSMDNVTELFFLIRGVRDVIDVTRDYIARGPMAELFDAHRMPEGTEITLPDEVSAQFSALRQMLVTWGLDPEALAHCQSALTDLDEIYRNIIYWASRGHVETGQVFRWKIMVNTGYVRLVQARCQPALIIFAYYAAATTAVRTAWYTQNWGEYAVRGVSFELDAHVLPLIEWPTRQVEQRMAALGVQLPPEQVTPMSLIGHSADPSHSGPTTRT